MNEIVSLHFQTKLDPVNKLKVCSGDWPLECLSLFSDQHILEELERKKIVVFTPSRRIGGKRMVCYDDRFIVKLAHDLDGIIVSNDTYRDLQSERAEWKRFIEERLLMFSFVNDKYVDSTDSEC